MLKIFVLPPGIQPIEQESLRCSPRIHDFALRFPDIDSAQFIERIPPRVCGIVRKGFIVGEGSVFRGGFEVAGEPSRLDLGITRYALLPELEIQVFVIVRSKLGKELLAGLDVLAGQLRKIVRIRFATAFSKRSRRRSNASTVPCSPYGNG